MTAINCSIGPNSLVMMTDTARLSLDGKLVDHMTKAVVLPHRNMVVAARGWASATARLAAIVNTFPDYDAALRDLMGEVKRQYHLAVWRGRISLLAPFDLVVAGVSRSGEFGAFTFSNHRRYAGVLPFDPLELTGPGSVLIFPRTSINEYLQDLATHDHIAAVTQAIVSQRSVPMLDGIYSGVGGFAVSTLITRNGIAQNAIATWNDTPGQKLDPKAEFKPLGVNNPKPLSRPKRQTPMNFMTAGNSGFTVQ